MAVAQSYCCVFRPASLVMHGLVATIAQPLCHVFSMFIITLMPGLPMTQTREIKAIRSPPLCMPSGCQLSASALFPRLSPTFCNFLPGPILSPFYTSTLKTPQSGCLSKARVSSIGPWRVQPCTFRYGTVTEVLAECMLNYYRVRWCTVALLHAEGLSKCCRATLLARQSGQCGWRRRERGDPTSERTHLECCWA